MTVPARRARVDALANDSAYFDPDPASSFGTLDVGEPIYPPRQRGSSMLGASLVLLVLFGGGWAAMNAPADWRAALRSRIETLSSLVDGRGTAVATANTASMALDAPAPTTEPIAITVPPAAEPLHVADASTPPDAAPVETAAISGAEEPAEAQPLPPPQADPADPYQQRAVAVGLHPGLSRVLLARLSAADYRNAGHAIDMAIAKTADDAELVWPRQRKPEQALFRVHFVPGAAPQCRRYVVTVEKDRWLTTAAPMERCGVGPVGSKAGARVEDRAEDSGVKAGVRAR